MGLPSLESRSPASDTESEFQWGKLFNKPKWIRSRERRRKRERSSKEDNRDKCCIYPFPSAYVACQMKI